MKTLFNHELVGWTNFNDNQLLRCPEHKKLEADIILSMPKNSSFLDVGAHYGDTVFTMALFAKHNHREDIRFFAFEPNEKKYQHIKHIVKLNQLNITVFQTCVGYVRGKASNDNVVPSFTGATSYKLNQDGEYDIIRLDDIEQKISPIGCAHIDAEGWDCHVLRGMENILQNKQNKGMHIIIECWNDDTAEDQVRKGRGVGVSTGTPERDITNELSKYQHITFVGKFKDMDCNLMFRFD